MIEDRIEAAERRRQEAESRLYRSDGTKFSTPTRSIRSACAR
jgi:hypothetical protein